MTIKIIRIIEKVEDKENLIGYGFADDDVCVIKLDSQIKTYVVPESFDKMVQEMTDDIRGIAVFYEEVEIGEKMRG